MSESDQDESKENIERAWMEFIETPLTKLARTSLKESLDITD